MKLRRPFLPALVLGALLVGCSSTPSDREQIASIIKREGVSPATLCSHLTGSLMARLGGKTGCLRQAASVVPDPTTHATTIRVHRDTATAVVVDRNGTRRIRLIKEKGVWKVTGVG